MSTLSNTIFLIGERPLVVEWAELCLNNGLKVICKLNEKGPKPKLPRHLKHSKTIPRKVLLAVELTNTDKEIKKKNLQPLDKALPSSTFILTSSVIVSVSEQATWVKHPSRLVGISALPTLLSQKLIEVAPTLETERAILSRVQDFFIKLGKEISVVQDRVGMVMPRILCMLINEAFFAVMEGIASPQDIDTAMKLGTNYPMGPLAWADRIGLQQILAVLEAIYADLGEERYRIAPLLKQMALSGSWWNMGIDTFRT